MNSRCCSLPLCKHERVVGPRYGVRRAFSASPLFLTVLVLVLVLLWTSPVSAVVLEGHILGRASGTSLTVEPTLEFTRDDRVISEVSLVAADEGDLLRWEFTGPEGTNYQENRTLSSGQRMARATFDLSLLPSNEAVGSWTLDLFLNGEPADRQDFTVEPLTGLVWWGPFAGVLVFFIAAVLCVLVVVGIVVIFRAFRKKKEI